MKKITKFMLSLCAFVFGGVAAHAESETILLNSSNGLPGTLSNGQYTFESSKLTAKNPFKFMRLTFFDTQGHNTFADKFKFVCISEFYLLKEDGTQISLAASNFSTNATEATGEGPISNICDGNTASGNFWHSAWSNSVGDYHYLQIQLPDDIEELSSYKLKWVTRNANNSPISLAVTTGATADEVKNLQWKDASYYNLLGVINGLPGTDGPLSGQKTWTSDFITFDEPVDHFVFKVLGTNTGALYGDYPFFTLSEFRVYKEDGTEVTLTGDNFSCNALTTQGNDAKGGVAALCDKDNNTFLHTAYSGNGSNPNTYHQLVVTLPEKLSKFKIAFDSRNGNNIPNCVQLQAYTTGNKAIETGVYRIVSANAGFGATTRAMTGSLKGNSCTSGWQKVDLNNPEQYWKINGDLENGYTLQNYHFGDKKYLSTGDGNGAGNGAGSSLVDEGSASKYTFNYLGDEQFNIFRKDAKKPLHCANQADGWEQSSLTTWEGGLNTASAWKLVKLEEVEAAKISLNSALNGVAGNMTVADNAIGSNPGQVSTTLTLDELKAKVKTLNEAAITAKTAVAGTEISAMESAYQPLVAAKVAVPTANAVAANKYYRLKGSVSNNYAVATAPSTQMTMAALGDDNTSATIFYLSGNKLLSYDNGYYVNETREIGALGNASTWNIANSNKLGTLTFKATAGVTGGNGIWMYDNNTKVDRFGNSEKDNCKWYLETVTTLPVKVSAAGYATLYAPVALTIPADVEVYTAAFEDSRVVLTSVDGGVVPANKGVVIKAAAGTYNFDITTTEETIESELTGNIATATVAADQAAYILGKNAEAVGFYKLNGTDRTIKGGRAYYVAPSGEAAAFLFNGTATGIEAIEAALNDVNAPIYDLSGRKVANAVKGGVYIKNGKKFIVK